MNDKITKKSFPWKAVGITGIVTMIGTLVLIYTSGLGVYFQPQKNNGDMSSHSENSHETIYTCGMHPWITQKEPGNCPICGMKLTPKKDEKTDGGSSGEKKVAYWRAPMNPNEIYDQPGKSAMGMDLVPVYEDEVKGGVEVKIDPVTQQNMGIRIGSVKRGTLVHTIRTYGHVTYDETRMSQVNPKFSGWIEKLYIDFTGQMVRKGDPLFDIYSPELITVQNEYLEAYKNFSRYPGKTSETLFSSVRRKLKFFDIADKEIDQIEKSGKVKDTLTIRSPFTGVITEKSAVEGSFVKAGTTVYKLADLSHVWVEAHIYEYELSLMTTGLNARMTLPYLPGKSFDGKVTYIYPYLQRKTRDIVIRLEFENPALDLKPDMYADVYIETGGTEQGLIIPSEAVIHSGKRTLVFVKREEGKFSPREVTLGMSLDDDNMQVLKGLAPGDMIVRSGQFLLDSESKLKEAVQKMMDRDSKKKSPVKQEDVSSDFFDDM